MIRYSISVFAAFVVVWAVAIVLDGSPVWTVYDADLREKVVKEGSMRISMHEGFSISRFGPYGFSVCEWIRAKGRGKRIFLWGDSFIEAWQVADEDKPDMALSKALDRVTENTDVAVLGLGASGYGLLDSAKRAADYERVFGIPICHVFFIGTNFEDDLSVIKSKVDYAQSTRVEFVKELKYRLAFSIADATYRRLKDVYQPSGRATKLECAQTVPVVNRIGETFTAIRALVNGPIVIAYCPNTIGNVSGGRVTFEDHNASILREVEAEARTHGMAFVDLSPELVRLYNEWGIVGRGFPNLGGPGNGHLNPDGIRAVFGGLAEHLKELYGL